MVFRFLLPPPILVPALVTRMSIRPRRLSMSAAVFSTAARSPTSSSIASALPAFFSAARPLSLVRAVRPVITTCAPALASSSPPASPMPEPPPVIQATFPLSSALGILLGPEHVLPLLGRHLGAAPVGEHLQRALHRGPGRDAVAPALDVRILLDVHSLALGKAQPRHGGHVGDGVLLAGDVLRFAQAPLENAVEPVGLVLVTVHRILDFLRRIAEEMMRLAQHRPDVAHLEHHPLHHLPALAQVLGQEPACLRGEVEKDRPRLGE